MVGLWGWGGGCVAVPKYMYNVIRKGKDTIKVILFFLSTVVISLNLIFVPGQATEDSAVIKND